MNFELSTEQDLLRESARRFLSSSREAIDGVPVSWADIDALGWPALAVPEHAGGLGGSLVDLALLCEEIGRACSALPFVTCAVLPARLATHWPGAPWSAPVLQGIAEGRLRPAVAIYEPGRRYATNAQLLLAEQVAQRLSLSGRKVLVSGYGAGGGLLTTARLSDGNAGRTAWAFVENASAGLQHEPYDAIDGTSWSDLVFDKVEVNDDRWASVDADGQQAMDAAFDEGVVCQCAQLLGGMEQTLDLTIDYLKTRHQFGQPLAQFQSLQHAVAEMSIDIEDSRSILYSALAALQEAPMQRSRAVSACRIKVMRTARAVNGMAIHLHGGIGVTCEYPVGHYLRQAMVIERHLGDEARHLQRYQASNTAAESH